MIRVLGYLTIVLAVAASGAQAQTGYRGPTIIAASGVAPSNERRTLTGAEIAAEIVGNTVTGTDKEGVFTEFLARNGAISGVSPSGPYRGAWRLKGDEICFYYYDLDPSDPEANKWDCNSVTIDDGKIYWSDEVDAGDSPDATLLAGNPKGL
jgi:hypothetical protein